MFLVTTVCKAPFTRYNLLSYRFDKPVVLCIQTFNRLSNPFDNRLDKTAVSYIQPVVKPVVQPGFTTSWTKSGCSFNTVVKPVVKLVWQPAVSCIQTFNRLSNRLDVCLHDTAGCQTICTTGLIAQRVWQPVVSCKRGFRHNAPGAYGQY